jgi:hypothetical protein
MNSNELQTYTVMKKLEYRGLLKKSAVNVLVNGNMKTNGSEKSNMLKKVALENSISDFRNARRAYKLVGE